MKPKVLIYYQTITTLKDILVKNSPVTHIHVSSIHFGLDVSSRPYIHLNNISPYHYTFKAMWEELEEAYNLGIKVKIMIGGAGGGYVSLFSNYHVFYNLLADLIRNKPFLSGVDLDIEEPVELDNVKKLIRSLKTDFGNSITISMAPVQSSLEEDSPGMGGFVYKDLLRSPEGKLIDYFNVQFYSDFSFNAFENVIKNEYLPEMIVMGAMAGEKNDSEIKKCIDKYGNKFGGVFVWEWCFAKPTPKEWAYDISSLLTKVNDLTIFSRIYNYLFLN